MKKIFSLFATALVALFGLTCCGGGGGSSSDAGYMTIQDFANASKMFSIGFDNSIWLEIRPTSRSSSSGGEITNETTSVRMNCSYAAGTGVQGELIVNYERLTDEGEFKLHSFSFDDDTDLAKPAVISAFGFTPSEIADDLSSTSGGIASLLELTSMYMILDMNAHTIQAFGTFVVVDEHGVKSPESGVLGGKRGTFDVNPN